MKGMLIPTDGRPYAIDIQTDAEGSALASLQRLVGGRIEPFDVLFGREVSLYVNDEGLFACPPNRAIYATKEMEQAGYLSQLDYAHAVREGELYTILHGDIVAVGFDPETGEDRDISDAELAQVEAYFTAVSGPGSGYCAAAAIRGGMADRRIGIGQHIRDEDGKATVKGKAKDSRAASEQLHGEQGGPMGKTRGEER